MTDPESQKIIRDPTTIKARIFIGNMPPNGGHKEELNDIFSEYGKIHALVANRGFAFLQFADEKSAAAAIEGEAGRLFHGKRLDVKQAVLFSNKRRNSPDRGPGGPGNNIRDRSPFDDLRGDDGPGGPDDERGERGRHRERGGGRGGGGRSGRDSFGPKPNWRDLRDLDRFDGPGFGGLGPGGPRGPRDMDDMLFDSFPPTDYPLGGHGNGPFGEGRPRGMMIPNDPYPPGDAHPSDRTNDCEIIVVNRLITSEYAEYIESLLKKIGMTVDLLFPHEEFPLGRVLANISGRGSLYAIIVTPQNEEHRSLTVNILYGQHQEHRNMPMEDAISLITRTFENYKRGERDSGRTGPLGMSAGFDRHPEALQTLFNLLKENRSLTVAQYEKVIRYLQDKKDKQIKVDGGDPKDPLLLRDAAPAQPASKQQELQSRIMNILNKKGNSGNDSASPAPAPITKQWSGGGNASPNTGGAPPAAGPQPLLNNPTVLTALDSLMQQGDILRKFNTNAPAPVPAPQPLFSAYGPGRKY